MNDKYLGINQPIPDTVLESVLFASLHGEFLPRETLDLQLSEFIRGKNRRDKAISHINLFLTRNQFLINELRRKMDGETFICLPESERKIVIICFLAITFPIFYETMKVLASVYKVQDRINTDSIISKLSANYGSNRGIYNALNAVLPMLVDLGLITRVKPGIFEKKETFSTLKPFLGEFCIYTDITLSTSKTILLEDIHHRPWYNYFNFPLQSENNFEILKFSELRAGYGYLEVRF